MILSLDDSFNMATLDDGYTEVDNLNLYRGKVHAQLLKYCSSLRMIKGDLAASHPQGSPLPLPSPSPVPLSDDDGSPVALDPAAESGGKTLDVQMDAAESRPRGLSVEQSALLLEWIPKHRSQLFKLHPSFIKVAESVTAALAPDSKHESMHTDTQSSTVSSHDDRLNLHTFLDIVLSSVDANINPEWVHHVQKKIKGTAVATEDNLDSSGFFRSLDEAVVFLRLRAQYVSNTH